MIYKTHGEFEQTNITLAELPEGVGAFAEPVQNRMVLPIDLPPDELYELIAHELTHIFQYSIFFEGYLGRALRSQRSAVADGGHGVLPGRGRGATWISMAIRDAVVNNILPPIEGLSGWRFLTYRYGHAIFDFIEQEHGKEGRAQLHLRVPQGAAHRQHREGDQGGLRLRRRGVQPPLQPLPAETYFPVLLEKKSPEDYGMEIGIKEPGVFTFSPAVSPSGELVAVLSAPKEELDLFILSAEDGEVCAT